MPWCVVYHQDKFFVCYCEGYRVVIFNNEGKYVYDIGSEGSGDLQLRFPIGLAIDKFDRLIVCDGGNCKLQLFTLDGKYITKIAGNFFHHGKLYVVPCLILEICLSQEKGKTVFMFSISTTLTLSLYS